MLIFTSVITTKRTEIMTTQEIKIAITENENITLEVGNLVYRKYNNGSTVYNMQDKYNVDKWADYTTEKAFVSAVLAKFRYETKKGITNPLTIK
jgi:hypothetical protein